MVRGLVTRANLACMWVFVCASLLGCVFCFLGWVRGGVRVVSRVLRFYVFLLPGWGGVVYCFGFFLVVGVGVGVSV